MIQFGLFYTAMSRVKTGNNLFIRHFNENYITANPAVEEKKQAMEIFSKYEFRKVFLNEKIFVNDEELKLGYINTRRLLEGKSLEYINNNRNLQGLDYLVVADTSLDIATSDKFLADHLSNWKVRHRCDSKDGQRHMGFLVLQGPSSSAEISVQSMIEDEEWRKRGDRVTQILNVFFPKYLLEASFVYINKTPTNSELVKLCDTLRSSHLIMGDLNLDMARIEDQVKLNKLCGETKKRVLNESTTDNFNQLDHVIIVNDVARQDVFSTSYYNYTSDHKTITVRIPNVFKNNHLSEKFKQRLHLDQYKYTRIGQKRKATPSHQSSKRKPPAVTSRKRRSEDIEDEGSTRKVSRSSVPVQETLPVLSQEMLSVIREVFALPTDNSEVVVNFGTLIRRRDIETLKDRGWLNSDIIDFMYKLIAFNSESTYSFGLDFSELLPRHGHEGVKGYTRHIDLFSYKKILVPVFTPQHWSCVGINLEEKRISYFDSLQRENQVWINLILIRNFFNDGLLQEFLTSILSYLDTEYKIKKNSSLNLQDWTLTHPKDIPVQRNHSDCGLFSIKYAQYFAKGRSQGDQMNFKQEDMKYYRRRMVWEIKTKTLLWP